MPCSSRTRDRGAFPRRRLELGLCLGVARRMEASAGPGQVACTGVAGSAGPQRGCVCWRGQVGLVGPGPKRSQAGPARLGCAKMEK
jgi:hypothetical protein